MNNKITGLTEEQVKISRDKYGTNKIELVNNNTFFKLLLESLGDPIIKILLVALAIKMVFLFKDFDWYETIGILISIFLASFISTISEMGSEKYYQRLEKEYSVVKVRVIRNSKVIEIDDSDVVVGDLVCLASGDRVVADGILIEGQVAIDESLLTGEKKEIYKDLNDKLYKGTVVNSKSGIMEVKSVGQNTYYGRLSKELMNKKAPSPLKLRLLDLAKTISKIGYIAAVVGALSYLFSSIIIANNFDMVKIINVIKDTPVFINHLLYALTLAITIIIVAVPEGLPMMITLVLSANMKRMIKENVLVRKLVGIETAGSLNLLCFDKTGTITEGKLSVIGIIDADNNMYKTSNDFKNEALAKLIKEALILNNEATYTDKGLVIGGNITDKAILKFFPYQNNIEIYTKEILEKEEFDSKKKYSKVVLKNDKILIKGAPEVLLSKCRYYYDSMGKKRYFIDKKKTLDKIDYYVSKGIRVLVFAIKDKEDKDFSFLGLVLIKDEVRKEAKKTIEIINKAGIKTIMITGDNIKTATSIAKEVNLLNSADDIAITSDEFNKLSDEQIKEKLDNIKVIARALPSDKSRLINIAKSKNLVVGMTGDGVNDALALKASDVGFGMGDASEVAKEASDIIIEDNNIKSICSAIIYGRTIFKSIRKFIIFQLSVNICAIVVSCVGPLFSIDMPITVMQMLWINMIMDTLAGLAFSYEAPILEYMEEPPKAKNEKIMNKYMINEIIVSGVYASILCLVFLSSNIFKSFFRPSIDDRYLMTAFFGLFIFIGIFNSFNARTSRLNILANLRGNKVFLVTFLFIIIIQLILIYFGGNLFRTTGLTFKELQIMLLLAFSIIPVDFIRKMILRIKGKNCGV